MVIDTDDSGEDDTSGGRVQWGGAKNDWDLGSSHARQLGAGKHRWDYTRPYPGNADDPTPPAQRLVPLQVPGSVSDARLTPPLFPTPLAPEWFEVQEIIRASLGGDDEPNKRIFDQLHARRTEVETAFGGSLEWQRMDGKKACQINYLLDGGGYQEREADWAPIQDGMINAMRRLKAVVDAFQVELS